MDHQLVFLNKAWVYREELKAPSDDEMPDSQGGSNEQLPPDLERQLRNR